MATTECAEINDIRHSTLCHHAEKLMNDNRMHNLERLNVGTHIVCSVIRNMPKEEQFRWFAFVMQEICNQSANLHVLPITEKAT